MISFLKTILKGLTYVLFLPLGLIGISLYAVFGVFVFIYQFGKFIYLFFTGRSFKSELEEDVEARKIIEANKPKDNSVEGSGMSLYPSDSDMYKEEYVSPTFPEKSNKETPVEENKEEDANE